MNVTVFGIGYVGLVQAAVLADAGHEVCCVDVDATKVENLKAGIIPIFEPGLSALVQKNHDAGRLHFTTDAAQGVRHGEVQFIAVGTPPDDDGSADIKYVLSVAATIALNMTEPKIIVNKSTVPVGTADKVRAKVSEVLTSRGLEVEFHVISNPEFLKEGSAVADCTRPDRIIIGSDSSYAVDRMRELYEPFNRNHEKIITMDIRSAELTKYAANCLLATKISFMNEMANFAERLGADIEAVRKGIGSDPRIGYDFIYPGCGYGGSCFPKDVQALERTASSIGYQATLLSAVEEVNKRQKQHLFGHIHHHFGGQLEGKTFAIWGLAFKPNTDDMREASSRVLIEQLRSVGARVQAFDPEAMAETQRIYGMNEDLLLMGTKEAALQGADALVIVTEWREFKAPDLDLIKEKLSTPVIFDGRNIFDPQRMKANGFEYYGIGRGLSVRPVV
ncbi:MULTISPECIES: UDP-glucose/GDP-mannose dehydrogenase family protein [Pseudomonas]|jgi:UDPglucose 6-dehydrogenase|uniref:UDP-glucose dehydrogenase family protein n=1 Tax=Pseudomonas TaxID=286 RepID=UPI000281CF2F|nr:MULTISPECIES: UDP-glucose/GDP-mannose dehydrogenase family protein [Pseudomonas]MDP9061973.1 UDP-glucose/GDP-mannose dehydrogenase family protein [Pseudomonadota bacterium]AUO22983.1 UDP-glucose/GDP-mannose dehydrogenase family protein [Pseudomonas sp. NC02]MBK3479359.1 UDP-glucose/GDP-mannose dehydrogenase family protein [Pseudomonas sp. MF6751]MBT1265917.1 UDP-glucose/GDP-mannose dehydrogenase family protein [Pseudomonas sp. VS38]MDE1913319.1 UDP-glucose/GDP-mannose dehydrogenase family p|eukprot:gene11208-13067_t